MKGIVRGGKQYYGEAIGIAIFDGAYYPMLPGDVGNATTYDFPVRIKVIKGLEDNPYPPLTNPDGSYTEAVTKTVAGVKELAAEGVRAVVTCCGFFSLVQDVLAKAVEIPVFTSPLLLIPLISRMLGPQKKIGVIAASKSFYPGLFWRLRASARICRWWWPAWRNPAYFTPPTWAEPRSTWMWILCAPRWWA